MGRPKGSRNASRIDPATRSTIGVRCTTEERRAYDAAAASDGLPTAAWIRRTLAAAVQEHAALAAALGATRARLAHASAFEAWIAAGKPAKGPKLAALERASAALIATRRRPTPAPERRA